MGIEVKRDEFFDTGTPLEYAKSFIRYTLEYSDEKRRNRKLAKKLYREVIRLPYYTVKIFFYFELVELLEPTSKISISELSLEKIIEASWEVT